MLYALTNIMKKDFPGASDLISLSHKSYAMLCAPAYIALHAFVHKVTTVLFFCASDLSLFRDNVDAVLDSRSAHHSR